MRTRDVERSFGNKKTWDTPFEVHFIKFVKEINHSIFDSGVQCYSLNEDVFNIDGAYDLVYLDPPYIKANGENNTTNYMN